MMQRKYLILILTFTAVVLLGAAVGIYVVHVSDRTEQVHPDKHPTNSHVAFEDDTPSADPAIVGKWQNSDNPKWYKVYYDDYDGDGFFWGKEWDESEDVQEEDLIYHGNGWFRWQKDKNQLLEMHTMDVQDTPIPKRWLVLSRSLPDSLILTNADRKSRCIRYGRVSD